MDQKMEKSREWPFSVSFLCSIVSTTMENHNHYTVIELHAMHEKDFQEHI